MKFKPNISPQVIQNLLNKVVIMQAEMEIIRLERLIKIEKLDQKIKGLSQRIAYM